jgi:hypothetical protein
MPSRPLSGSEIQSLVLEVAERLAPAGKRHVLIIVGGSLLAWHGLRESTEDVDSVRLLDDELRSAVASVAADHDLPSDWLNANAAMFIPATFDPDSCEVLVDHLRLLVLGAPMGDVFVMKMYRALPNDVADMIRMWPLIGFISAQQVVDAFFAAYPHAPADDHLDQYVIEIAARAGYEVPRS